MSTSNLSSPQDPSFNRPGSSVQETTLTVNATNSVSKTATFKGSLFTNSETNKPQCRRFLSVPYALPPTKQYRWRLPHRLPKDYFFTSPSTTTATATTTRPTTATTEIHDNNNNSLNGNTDGYGDNRNGNRNNVIDTPVWDFTKWGDICPQPVYQRENAPEPPPLIPGMKFSEDCLKLNIWMPPEDVEPPKDGFPVLFFIHGGWLQVGHPNHYPVNDPTSLYDETPFNAIVISAGYRLGVFGFLSSKELIGESYQNGGSHNDNDPNEPNCNFGLHDQRMALEWVWENIKWFGGNPENITISGLSAGAFSAHYQVCNEFFNPPATSKSKYPQSIISRMVLHSNSIPCDAKPLSESQPQFDALYDHFCPSSPELSPQEKLQKLREVPSETFAKKVLELDLHTFRPVALGRWGFGVDRGSGGVMEMIENGRFREEMDKRWEMGRGFAILMGEVVRESALYREINPPATATANSFRIALENYYPQSTITRAAECYFNWPGKRGSIGRTEGNLERMRDLFGEVCADLQVYGPERWLVRKVAPPPSPNMNGHDGRRVGEEALGRVLRYKVDKRAGYLDKELPKQMGTTHGTDLSFWYYARHLGLTEEEAKLAREWVDPYIDFIKGPESKDLGAQEKWWTGLKNKWGTKGIRQLRVMTTDGKIEVQSDHRWERQRFISDTVFSPQD